MVVRRLLRLKFYLTVNSLWRGGVGRKLRALFVGLLMVVAMFYAYSLSYELWRALLRTVGPEDTIQLLPLIFAGVFLFTLTGGVVSGLRQLYVATDLDLLFSLPIPLGDIYLVKSFEIGMSEGILILLAAMPLWAYGAAADLGPAYYLLIMPALIGLALLTIWLDMILVVGLVRLLPANRARNLMVMVSAGLGMVIYAGSRLFGIGLRSEGGRGAVTGFGDTVRQLASLGRQVAWLPPGWGGGILIGLGTGDLVLYALDSLLLFGATAALGALGYGLFARTFYQGWSATQGISTRRTADAVQAGAPRPRRAGPFAGLLPLFEMLFAPFPRPIRALIVKDWRTALRDPNYIMQTLWVFLIMSFSLFAPIGGARRDPGGFWGVLASQALVPYLLCQMLALPAFGREGSAFAILRGSGLSIREIFVAKWLQVFLPVTLLSWVLVAGIALFRNATPLQAFEAGAVALVLCAGLSLIGIAAGALAPEYKARRERSMQAGGALGLVTWLILSALFALVTLGIAAVVLSGPLGGGLPIMPGMPDLGVVAVVVVLVVYAVLLGVILSVVVAALHRLTAWEDL